MPKKNKNGIFEEDLGVITKEKIKVKKPDMYAVVLINDDYTPMEFVIEVLEKFPDVISSINPMTIEKSKKPARNLLIIIPNDLLNP